MVDLDKILKNKRNARRIASIPAAYGPVYIE
jgi:hypothetical protein